ncbi:MAG: hypothetical protein K0Q73_1162 [Paenibacillus sp.]|nr:hypothetical protein [Paenibacillus sp.]
MPMYLKKDSIRLLEASVDALSLSVLSLGLPQRYEFRESVAEYANSIGLAGVSAELAMSSIIVQANGEEALRLPSGFYKTGSHIADDFKKLISSKVPKMVFLTQGLDNPAQHISNIIEISTKFKLLAKLRAGGLHAGRGPSRDVCIACVNDVIKFIMLLGESSRIKSYIETLPRPIEITKSYELIVDDLIKKLEQSTSPLEKANALASIYLVIPELPVNEPEWLSSIERAVIAPQSNDISFLLDTLENSKYGSLIKVAKSKAGIPVTVQKGSPYAIPIEPQYLKKSFSDIKDRLYADIGTANGRLEQKQFDPPPIESVYEMFSFQYHVLNITADENELLTAAETWPLIAASLKYTGTLGPYWYFVRKTSDLGQLESYINRAAKCAGKSMLNGIKEFKIGLEALKKDLPLSKHDKQVSSMLSEYELIDKRRKNLVNLAKKYANSEKELCEDAMEDLLKVIAEDLHIGSMLVKLAENTYNFRTDSGRLYWARTLCESASELEDTQGLLAIITSPSLVAAHTAVRKAFRIIDFINYAPKIE